MKGWCLLMLLGMGTAALSKPAESPFSQPFQGPHWSVKGGITLALHDAVIQNDGSPRGLIRIVLPRRPGEAPRSLNFIAVEPCIEEGRRDLSELQNSPSDGKPGIKFWFGPVERTAKTLRQTIRMEKFANGAHPYLIAELRADRPMEVRFETYAEPDSAPMKTCILTATMGNMQRLRRLHLKGRTVTVNDVLPEDPGTNFTRHAVFPLADLPRDKRGVFVAAEGDEADPRILTKDMHSAPWWRYEGLDFTQYWSQPAPVDPDLRVLVNARKTYWASADPIPGGKAFENFEMNATFHPGQVFVFGVKSPAHSRAVDKR